MMTERIATFLVAALLICFNASAQKKKSSILVNDGDNGMGAITLKDKTVLRGQ
jgi:hypothetical protein